MVCGSGGDLDRIALSEVTQRQTREGAASPAHVMENGGTRGTEQERWWK